MATHSVLDEHEITEAELEAREAHRLDKIDNMKKAPTHKNLNELLHPNLKQIRKQPDVHLGAHAPAPSAPTPALTAVASPAPAPVPQAAHAPPSATSTSTSTQAQAHAAPLSPRSAAQASAPASAAQLFCPYCGTPSAGNKFCGGCGSKLSGPNVPAPAHDPVVHTPAVPREAVASAPKRRLREPWEHIPSAPQFGSRFEATLLQEVNLARQHPDSLLPRLRERQAKFNGLQYDDDEDGSVFNTAEGVNAVLDAMAFLSAFSLKDLPVLYTTDGLNNSAKDLVALLNDSNKANESQEQAQERLTRYGSPDGRIGQSISLADVRPIDVVLDWIIDDGQPKRPNRAALFNPEFKVVGISSGPNKSAGRAVVAIWASSYGTGSEAPKAASAHVPLPLNEPFLSPAKTDDLPIYRIGELRNAAVPSGAAYDVASELPISNLGCAVNEIHLELTGNGHYLEFNRSHGQYHDQQRFTLPHQVLATTVAARFNPSLDNGTLYITLGKPRPPQKTPLQGENILGKFTVWKDKAATNNRVMITMERGADYIRFFPGAHSKYDTEFTVVLNGTTLEFRSLYEESVEEEAGNPTIRAVNAKQSIQLPQAPSRDEIDVSGSSVKVHVPQSDDQAQPDITVPISVAQ